MISTTILVAVILLAAVVGLGIGIFLYKPKLEVEKTRRKDAESALERERVDSDRQKTDFENALSNLKVTFKGLSSEVLKESREEFIRQAEPKIKEHVNPLHDALKRYDDAIRKIENKREEAYGALQTLLNTVKNGQTDLVRETGSLVSALKSPSARGRWGEVTLRRVVELAGMSPHCDFEEQQHVEGDEGRLRPDMTVRLPGNRTVVVDAKVPIESYNKATEATTESARIELLGEHARAVRDHMRKLGQKGYWTQFESTPDFVVMFLPGESYFSAALEKDRSMIEDGMASHVVLATPTTLIVLLRSVAMSWQQQQLAENSERISEAGKDLFDRCVKFSSYIDEIGSGLHKAIKSFNSAVGSWDSRVVPGIKKLKELGATRSPDADVPQVEQIETTPRQLVSSDQTS